MNINLDETRTHYKDGCIEISASTHQEAFVLGGIYEKLRSNYRVGHSRTQHRETIYIPLAKHSPPDTEKRPKTE